MKLGEIASIRTGLVITRKRADLESEIEETYKLFTLKNINDNGSVSAEPYELFYSNDVLEQEYFTEMGDILIRLSHPYTAVAIGVTEAGLLVPSSFAILKLKTGEFIAGYIAWYLNTEKIKRELMKHQTGTAMATTNKAVLEEIRVRKLPIDVQKNLSGIQELYFREQELLEQLTSEKEKYFNAIAKKLI